MKKTIDVTSIIFVIIALFFLSGCMADMRTSLVKEEGIRQSQVEKGKAILETAWRTHGLQHLKKHDTYSFHGSDIWKGMMGKMGKPWPEAKSEIEFKYAVGTFDSQAYFMNGKWKGILAGLQSWEYYERDLQQNLQFKEYNKRIGFGLSAYQYFFEMLDRLKDVPIISYAGQKEFNGNRYDLVFATWQKAEPHMENDQYILWINRQTKMLDYAVYSLRDNYLKIPGYKAFYGSIQFGDYKEIEGIMIPHRQTVYLNQPSKKEKRHLHQLIVTDFSFDNFDVSELYPDPKIAKLGDRKK